MQELRSAVFLDRDGTLIEERHYLSSITEISVLEGASEAITRLNNAGFAVVVATNQSAVGRGLLSLENLNSIHREIRYQLKTEGAQIDEIFFCPHHPTEATRTYRSNCTCRKPKPGMLEKAARQLTLDLRKSFMIGDTLSDIKTGHAAGCRSILVKTGKGRQEILRIKDEPKPPDFIAENLTKAVDWLLEKQL